MVVAVTKSDLLDDNCRPETVAGIRRFLNGSGLDAAAPIVFTSALTGDGLGELRLALASAAADIAPPRESPSFYLPIDRAFVMAGHGTVVTGTLRGAAIRTGETVEIAPRGTRVEVRGLQAHGKVVDSAELGRRVAVNLRGIKRGDIRRGDALVRPGVVRLTTLLDTRLRLLPAVRRALIRSQNVRLYVGTGDLNARVYPLESDSIAPGESQFAQLRLSAAICVPRGTPFVIRSLSPPETLGGGRVLDNQPSRKSKLSEISRALLEALDSNQADLMIAEKLREAGIEGRAWIELLNDLNLAGPELASRPLARSVDAEAAVRPLVPSAGAESSGRPLAPINGGTGDMSGGLLVQPAGAEPSGRPLAPINGGTGDMSGGPLVQPAGAEPSVRPLAPINGGTGDMSAGLLSSNPGSIGGSSGGSVLIDSEHTGAPSTAVRGDQKLPLFILGGEEEVRFCSNGVAVHRDSLRNLCMSSIELLTEFHEANPRIASMPRDLLRRKLPPRLRAEVFGRLIDEMLSEGYVSERGPGIRLAGFEPKPLTLEEAKIAESIENSFRRAKLKPPDIESVTKGDPGRKEMLTMLLRSGRLVEIENHAKGAALVLHSAALSEARQIITTYLSSCSEGITVSEANELLGTTRKFSIPLLESLDGAGVTQRMGDRRVL